MSIWPESAANAQCTHPIDSYRPRDQVFELTQVKINIAPQVPNGIQTVFAVYFEFFDKSFLHQMILSSSIFTRRKVILGICIAALIAGGVYFYCFHQTETPSQIFQHFRNAERIEFCTMKPHRGDSILPEDFGYRDIEGYSIVDRVYLKNQASVINAITWADRMNNSTAASCFNPRHAIRDAEDENNYLLICFECLQMHYQVNGESGTALISQGQARYFEQLVDKHSMTRAIDLRTD